MGYFETVFAYETHFEESAEDINVKATVFRSRRSGLSVIFCHVPSECVFGTFVFPTKPHPSNKPLAACVQRMTLCASENYPASKLPNIGVSCKADFVERLGREISLGFTGQILQADRSVYTVNTQNYRGLIALLPPYLDSLFLPRMTEKDFNEQIYCARPSGRPALDGPCLKPSERP